MMTVLCTCYTAVYTSCTTTGFVEIYAIRGTTSRTRSFTIHNTGEGAAVVAIAVVVAAPLP